MTKPQTKSLSPADDIDLSLFAHIQDDPFLKGTIELEGSQFRRTVGYLGRFLSTLKDDEDIPGVRELQVNMLKLVDVENEMIDIRISFDPTVGKLKLEQLSETLAHDVLTTLQKGEYLTIPGGWQSADKSHAMAYQFKRTLEGLAFYVHNTGAGLRYHEKKSTRDRELFYPVQAYSIAIPGEVTEKKLSRFIKELLLPQLPNLRLAKEQGFDATDLYEKVLPKIQFLQGELIPAATVSDAFTAGQLSDTCAQRVLHQMLKSNIKTLAEHQRFIYKFKRFALDDYIGVLQRNNQLDDRSAGSMIDNAINTMLRTLNIKDLFSDEFIEGERANLKSNRKLLKEAVKEHKEKPSEAVTVDSSTTVFDMPTLPSVFKPNLDSTRLPQMTSSLLNSTLQGGATLINELDALLRECVRLNDLGDSEAIIQGIERVLIQFPLPQPPQTFDERLPFYEGISAENLDRFYHQMDALQEAYLMACKDVCGGATLPSQVVFGLSMTSVLDYVTHQWPFKTGGKILHHQLVVNIMKRFFFDNGDNPYFATNSPVLDERLKEIQDLYSYETLEGAINRVFEFYNELIDSEPELKKRLLTLYMPPQDRVLARLLEQDGYKALYHLATNFERLSAELEFKPLIAKFQRQRQLEESILKSLIPFLSQQEKYSKEIVLGLSSQKTLGFNSIGFFLQTCFHNQILSMHKYKLSPDKAAYDALIKSYSKRKDQLFSDTWKRTDNYTQLLPSAISPEMIGLNQLTAEERQTMGQRSIDKTALAERELFHLRAAPNLEIQLSLDYFEKHMSKLSDPAIQIYLEANLFQPGLLSQELSDRLPNISQRLENFVEHGLRHFAHRGQSSKTSLFFIHLDYLLNRYAAEYLTLPTERLLKVQQRITTMLEIDNNNASELKQALHQYQFLTAMARLELTPDLSSEEPEKILDVALPSFLYMNANRNSEEYLDTAFMAHLEQAKHRFRQFVEERAPEQMALVLPDALNQLGLGVCERLIAESSVFVTVTMKQDNQENGYRIDIKRGLVFNSEGLALTPLPLNLLNHPVMEQLAIKPLVPCMASLDGRVFELIDAGVRFIRQDEHGQFRVQKKWTVNGQTQWYELRSQNEAQQRSLGLEAPIINLPLPEILKQRNMQLWAAFEDEHRLLITENQQPRYHLKPIPTVPTVLEAIKINADGTESDRVLCIGETSFHRLFSTFESPEFVTVCQNKEGAQITFARYDLTLNATQEGETWRYHLDNLPMYTLVADADSLIPGAAGLVFENMVTHHRLCYLPVQPFIPTGNPSVDTAFYELKPDIAAIVPHSLVEEHKANVLPWQYTGIERTFCYQIAADGSLHADIPRDALYLCYVYLCCHQPEKAWKVLDDCAERFGGIQSTVDELMMLNLIINGLPRVIEKKHKDATIDTPPYLACQLKAIALLTSTFTPDKPVTIPNTNADTKTPDGWYQQQNRSELQQLNAGLNGLIYGLYSRYQNMQRHLKHSFQLSDVEKKCLLDYYYFHLPEPVGSTKALGAMGYAWKALGIKLLKKEYVAILAELKYRGKLSVAVQKRLDEIKQFLEQDALVSQNRSDIEAVPLDLSIPPDMVFSLDQLTLSERDYKYVKGWFGDIELVFYLPPEQQKVLERLTEDITEGDLLRYFSDYFKLAISPATDGSEPGPREVFLNFCRQYLAAHRHTPLAQQTQKTTFLVNILYRISENPDAFQQDKLKDKDKKITVSDVIQRARALPDPTLKIAQVVDRTHEILASARDIWDALDEVVTAPQEKLTSTTDPSLVEFDLKHLLDVAYLDDDFHKGCEAYKAEVKLFSALLPRTADEAAVTGVLSPQELKAGREQNCALQKMKQIARGLLTDPLRRLALQQGAESMLLNLDVKAEERFNNALILAESGPSDLKKKRHIDIAVEAGARPPWDKNRLLLLYFKADRASYALETGLSDEKIQELHTELGHFIALSVRQQTLQRLCQKLQISEDDASPAVFEDIVHELLTDDLVDYEQESVLAFFQYEANILLRPQQISALRRLLTTPDMDKHAVADTVEKIVMGGGKSKVVLPVLTQRLATGHNVVFVAGPRALFHTDWINLLNTSGRLFHQKAWPFEFSRDSDCSPQSLELIYTKWQDVIANKDYFVTTVEALQSIDLKYKELLGQKPKKDNAKYPVWVKQVQWLGKIVSLSRTRADVLLDEVHQGLLLKKKLNYALGEHRSAPVEIIESTVALYRFFAKVSLSELGGALVGKTLALVLQDNSLMTQKTEEEEENKWQEAMQALANALFLDPKSPLQSLFMQMAPPMNETDKKELLQYFFNEGNTIPTSVYRAVPKIRNIFALYKEQLSHLLGHTLKRTLNENYGASHQHPETVIAIPYSASNTPNEGSLFGNYLASINYSVQMMMIDGIPKALLKRYLNMLQVEAKQELLKNHTLTAIDNTSIAKTFKASAPAIRFLLSEIDLADDEQFTKVYQVLKKNADLMDTILAIDVLPQVRVEDEILSSNAISFVDSCRRVIGLSGTPYNYLTYHQRIHFDPHTATASDGFVIDVIKEKRTEVRTVSTVSAVVTENASYALLNQLFAGKKPDEVVRAIIDICARFKGIKNVDVSRQIAKYIREHPVPFSSPVPIEYVLFFNEKNVLCALNVKEGAVPIEIGSTDPLVINQTLGCKPEARFSFYDQAHILGVDLKQAQHAKALVLVDHETRLFSGFTQGCMRMRGLPDEQCVEIMVPENLGTLTLEELLKRFEENQENESKQAVFDATEVKLSMLVANDLYERLLALPEEDVEGKHAFLETCGAYFKEQHQKDFFETFGKLIKSCPTKDILDMQRSRLMEGWKQILTTELGVKDIEDMSTLMLKNLNKIIEDALPYCQETYTKPVDNDYDFEVLVEDIADKLTAVEVAFEKETLKELYNPQLKPAFYLKPPFDFNKRYIHHKTIGMMCVESGAEGIPEFGNIYMGPNYYKTYENQTKYLGGFLKPVHVVMFRQFKDGHIDCFILSQQEACDLHAKVDANKDSTDPTIWLTTTQHAPLAGEPPANIREKKEYQQFIEQLRFFNGELNLFMDSGEPMQWLAQDSEKQLTFFKQYLMSCRELESEDIERFTQYQSERIEALSYIARHPHEDYAGFDWKTIILDDLTDADIRACEKLADAFHYVNDHWHERTFNFENYLNSSSLSLPALSYLKNYHLHQLQPLMSASLFQYIKGKNGNITTAIHSLLPALLEEFLPKSIDFENNAFLFLLYKMGLGDGNKNAEVIANWIAKKAPGWLGRVQASGLTPIAIVIQQDSPRVLRVVEWLLGRGVDAKSIPEAVWNNVSDEHMQDYLKVPKLKKCESYFAAFVKRYMDNDQKLIELLHACPKSKTLLQQYPERLEQLKSVAKSMAASEKASKKTFFSHFGMFAPKHSSTKTKTLPGETPGKGPH